MTERLYYDDPYLTEFDARIVRLEHHEGRAIAVLDRTAFYPTSGGQLHDTGLLQSIPVVEVFESAGGEIAHALDSPGDGLVPGTTVRGVIDWDRRFDFMQQHTGQHLLSASFDRLLRATTKSVHLGQQRSTIDLDRVIDEAEGREAESDANRVVWDDRAVTIRYTDDADRDGLALRRVSTRSGRLRLIDIDGHDLSACGGTHVARTGGVGVIVISNIERHKGGTRIEFACGRRAVQTFHEHHATVTQSIQLLSALPSDLPSAIARLQADLREAGRSLEAVRSTLASHRAAALVARAERLASVPVACALVDGDDGEIKEIARLVAETHGVTAILVSNRAPHVVMASCPDGRALDASLIIHGIIARVGGRGGGKVGFAQAGGIEADGARVLDVAREVLSATLQRAPPAG